MTAPAFIHLHVHSAYSLLEGAMTVKGLAKLAEADGLPALAITDRNNLFGALEFSEYLAGAGIQPIIGCSLNLAFPASAEETSRPGARPAPHHGPVVLLAKDAEGYGNLMKLSSLAYVEHGDNGTPHVTLAELEPHAAGLIALSGGPDGPVDRAFAAGNAAVAEARLDTLERLFAGRFYVEIQRHNLPRERLVEPQLLRWAYERRVPLVATNEAYFPKRDTFEAHDALLCIADGRYVAEDDRRRLSPEHWLKPQAEMAALFADLPEAAANTIEIAKRCSFRPRPRKPILPLFVPDAKDAAEAEAAELRAQAEAGLAHRLAAIPEHLRAASEEDYKKRLEFELDIITRMKFPGYFLIVSDFIKWSKAQRHSRGAGPRLGRGLGGGLVADDHRSRSDPLRPAVRAIPKSRARVDAGLRHRLLPGPARRGDPVRSREVRREPRRADHHLRKVAGARGLARRGPRTADALRPGRPAVQDWCRTTRPTP